MTEEQFIKEVLKLKIELTPTKLLLLEKYYLILKEWNTKINLTRIIDKKDVYLKHFYDSLTIIKVIDLNKNAKIVDLGTGAGFPGLVLKIVFSNLNVTLIESCSKKVLFLNEVIKTLELTNIVIIEQRVEQYALLHREEYDYVVARAFSKLSILIELGIPLLKIKGKLIAMKGIVPLLNNQTTLTKIESKVEKIINFKLPIINHQRTLIVILKLKKTNKKYPRSYAQIKKKPL